MYVTLFLCAIFFASLGAESPTVLITGANRGLGLEFARQYHEKGFTVIGTARKPEKAAKLNALGVRVEQLDVTEDASVKSLASRLRNIPIDLLINNAGILRNRSGSMATLDFDDFDLTFAVNSTGPMRVTQSLLPNLRQGNRKKIVSITSMLGSIERNRGGMYSYRASKAALNQLNKTMSLELGSEGFTCLVLHPGWVATDMGGAGATYAPEESVRSMIEVIDNLNPSDNGRYLDLDGQSIPW